MSIENILISVASCLYDKNTHSASLSANTRALSPTSSFRQDKPVTNPTRRLVGCPTEDPQVVLLRTTSKQKTLMIHWFKNTLRAGMGVA